MDKIKCRVLTGPTASGKSELALRLAEENGWDLLCMDSMQIYRGMDIGTAKPTPEERKRVPHHLLDLCEPNEAFSAAMYREKAEALILDLWNRKKREVLFVGGTGLYMSAMIHSMAMGAAPADEGRRNELHALAEKPGGKEELHQLLKKLDPATAERLPMNDIRRTIRAIEVTETTGIPFSRQPREEGESPFDWVVAATCMPRDQLYERINLRVLRMMKQGLKEEVAGLLDRGIPETAQSMSGLGYKEMIPCIRGICTEEEAVQAIQLGTRHYAKRQMTFLRREPLVQYADVAEPGVYEKIRTILR